MEVFKDIDNNEYELIELYNQLWSTSNFKASKFNDGTEIKLATSKNEWRDLLIKEPAYCYVNFDENNKEMGHIYNPCVIRNEKSILPRTFELPTIRDCEGLFDLAEIKLELQKVNDDLALLPEFISHDTWPEYTRKEWEGKLHNLEAPSAGPVLNYRDFVKKHPTSGLSEDDYKGLPWSREEKEELLVAKRRLEKIGFEHFAEYRKGRNGLGLNIKNFSTTEEPHQVYYYLKDETNKPEYLWVQNMLQIKIYGGVRIDLATLRDHGSYFIRPVINSSDWLLTKALEELL